MGENLNMHEEVVAEPVEEMAAPALDTGEEPVAQNKEKETRLERGSNPCFQRKSGR